MARKSLVLLWFMLSKGLLLFKNDAFRGKIVNSEHGGSQTQKGHLLLKNYAFRGKIVNREHGGPKHKAKSR